MSNIGGYPKTERDVEEQVALGALTQEQGRLVSAGLTISDAASLETMPGGTAWPASLPVTEEERSRYASLRSVLLARATALTE